MLIVNICSFRSVFTIYTIRLVSLSSVSSIVVGVLSFVELSVLANVASCIGALGQRIFAQSKVSLGAQEKPCSSHTGYDKVKELASLEFGGGGHLKVCSDN